MPGRERGKYLYRIARLIQEKSRELAVLETMDGGKTIKESRDIDLPLVAAHFFYYAGWADKLEYAFPGRTPRARSASRARSSRGIFRCSWRRGNWRRRWRAETPACLKPAETTSITAMHLAEIFQEAELPDGVVNIVTGAGATGQALVESSTDINKIAFTGSTAVGKMLTQAVAGTKKKLTLELGGKAANIIFEDAPLDQAVEGIIAGIYFNQGHVCCAGSRLLVQEGVFPQVIRKLRDRIATLRVGNPLDKNTDIGAINSRMQLDKIRELVDSGLQQGAELVQPRCTLPEKGYWYPPSFLHRRHRVASHRAGRNLRPGPERDDFPHAGRSDRARQQHAYGLSAGVWTDKGSKIFKIVSKLRAGVVWANTYNKFDPTSPFGGYKESGFGREGGRHGLLPYLNLS